MGALRKRWWRWAAAALAAIGFMLAWKQLPVESWVLALIGWTEQRGAGGMLIFAGAYTVAMVLCLWGTPFTLAAGVLFGLWWGAFIATASATAGSTIAFLLGRHLGRKPVERWVARDDRFRAIDAAVGDKGWTIVFLTRLSPIIPFSISNYVFGVTRVSLGAFVGASLLAIAPGSFLVAYLGHIGRMTLTDEFESLGAWHYVLIGGGLAGTAGIVACLAWVARNALARIQVKETRRGQAGSSG